MKDILFGELTTYMAQAKEGLNEGNFETMELGHDNFTHKVNLETRIMLLLFVQKKGSIAFKITPDELLNMYANLMERLTFDAKMFYRWFNPILGNSMWIDSQTVQDFFNQKFLTNATLAHDVSADGFTCISNMLLMVNENQGNLIIDDTDFVLNVAPSELVGYALVWEMYEYSNRQEVIDFLGKLHYRSSEPEVHKSFIAECFTRMDRNNLLVG